ncbi:MAG: Uncharacterized protein FD161_3288 [Limisphaerales bacterium]|nr:MAG: Uncharacterized protein FD161_3288 [Limisphaerales bacterium]KAG0507896.1 MAG: Uncharacterized protein E1N63_2954 [Limisphaerales bacterium]TXT49993.1 MAG: Uncharacterized protein FD140_2679 [Limisphaerales bacterium]
MSTTENQDNTEPAKSVIGWQFWLAVLLVLLGGVLLVPKVFVRTRSETPRGRCIFYLKQIDGAVQQWALEKSKAATDTYSLTDTYYLLYHRGSVLPVCPLGGRYSPGKDVMDIPRCSVPGHTL